MTAAGEAAATGAKAAAEAESVTDGEPYGQRPKPANRGNMTATQRRNWRKRRGGGAELYKLRGKGHVT